MFLNGFVWMKPACTHHYVVKSLSNSGNWQTERRILKPGDALSYVNHTSGSSTATTSTCASDTAAVRR